VFVFPILQIEVELILGFDFGSVLQNLFCAGDCELIFIKKFFDFENQFDFFATIQSLV
jgi:hypothetical protein